MTRLADASAGRLKPGAGTALIQQSSTGASNEWMAPAKVESLLKFGLYAGAAALAWFFYSRPGSAVEPRESGVEPGMNPNLEDYPSWEPEQ